MPVIEVKRLLARLLDECSLCMKAFVENVALIVDDNGQLTEEQTEAIFVSMYETHQDHDV